MSDLKASQFNEVFLTQSSSFDVRRYAYDIFFACEKQRFYQISKHWARNFGGSSQNYMANNFYSWKSNNVSPNSSSRHKIVDSTLNTFSKEEKFVYAYNSIAKYIARKYPKSIKLSQIAKTTDNLNTAIDEFSLEKDSSYFTTIYKASETDIYESTVKGVLKVYMTLIFNKLEEDVKLIKTLINKANTEFLTITYQTYLFGIYIDSESFANERYRSPLKTKNIASFDSIWHTELSNLSLKKVAEIKRASDTTLIDGILTMQEIDKFINSKINIVKSKSGGKIKLNLKSHSGILDIQLRILSDVEKITILFRGIVTITILVSLLLILLNDGQYFGYLIIAFFFTLIVIAPDKEDFTKPYTDLKTKYLGK